MRHARSVLLVLVGMVIGSASSSLARVAPATTPRGQQVPVALATEDWVHATFVRDPKSGGCWILVRPAADASMLAVAPPAACS